MNSLKNFFILIGAIIYLNKVNAQILFDNGIASGGSGIAGLVTTGINGSGGAPVSMLSQGSTALGWGAQLSQNYSIADDFVISGCVSLDSIRFYAYQTNSGTVSTLNDLRVRIYNGAPNNGGTLVWGNFSTNVLLATTWTGIYRVSSSDTFGSSRPIMSASVGFNPPLKLSPGTYWVEYSVAGSSPSGPFSPSLDRQPNPVTGNALQYLGSWIEARDNSSNIQQDIPFTIYGTGGLISLENVSITHPSTGQSDGSIMADICGDQSTIRYSRWAKKGGINYPESNELDLSNADAGDYTLMLITNDNNIHYYGPYTLSN